jgi:hypothetical protein
MSTEQPIRELIKTYLADNRNVDGVQFIDQLLLLAAEAGEIKCTLAGDGSLRFQIPEQPPWEIELERAKAKLRMLCARLGVLCNETGDQEVSLYGGEGTIKKETSLESLNDRGRSSLAGTSLAAPLVTKQWKVRFKNTPSEQEFTIISAAR